MYRLKGDCRNKCCGALHRKWSHMSAVPAVQ